MRARGQRRVDPGGVRVFAGSSHPALARAIARYLRVPLAPTHVERFSNDNLCVQLGRSVRSRAVFVVQSLVPPVSEHLLELLLMLDAARGAAAREVHAIVPYFSPARSDKKDKPRISIAARLIADLLQTAGATHFMTMTLHSPQVHGFFGIPADPLTARASFVRHFSGRRLGRAVVVAPDSGGATPAARFAEGLGLPALAAQKTRLSDLRVAISPLIGKQVGGFDRVLIYDDEVSTGASVLELSRILVESGVRKIHVVCTHGLFTGGALDKLEAIPQILEIVTTDTVPPPPAARRPSCLKVLPVAPIFGEAIRRNWTGQSIGSLFSGWK
jgi:ribose-phosphate pyrophosphokinase